MNNNGEPCTSRGVSAVRGGDEANLWQKCHKAASSYSIIGIIHELESRSISSPTGKPKWCRRAIDTLLSNEKYRGGSTATTVLMSDAPQSKQRARYLFSDHHEAIIDEKTFIAVAKEKQRRCNIEVDENGVHRKKTRYTAKIRVSGSLKEE